MFNIFGKFGDKGQQHSVASILVIEDSASDRMFIQRVLEKKGHSVFIADDGEIGLNIIYRNKIDLIILDYILPGMNGLKIGHILKADARTKNIPIIFLTVVESAEAVLGCYEFGADAYLHKPVGAKELLGQVEMILEDAKGKDIDRAI